eukprot:Sdes_comp20560_c0_seq1m15376
MASRKYKSESCSQLASFVIPSSSVDDAQGFYSSLEQAESVNYPTQSRPTLTRQASKTGFSRPVSIVKVPRTRGRIILPQKCCQNYKTLSEAAKIPAIQNFESKLPDRLQGIVDASLFAAIMASANLRLESLSLVSVSRWKTILASILCPLTFGFSTLLVASEKQKKIDKQIRKLTLYFKHLSSRESFVRTNVVWAYHHHEKEKGPYGGSYIEIKFDEPCAAKGS